MVDADYGDGSQCLQFKRQATGGNKSEYTLCKWINALMNECMMQKTNGWWN